MSQLLSIHCINRHTCTCWSSIYKLILLLLLLFNPRLAIHFNICNLGLVQETNNKTLLCKLLLMFAAVNAVWGLLPGPGLDDEDSWGIGDCMRVTGLKD